jgi:peptide/nickel transport system substrate-binding protein
VTFQHTAGPDGLHLVPDLALALAVPTRAARSYTFRLRPGIHYANGIELKASDVRRGIQRLFRVGSPGAAFYTNIVGGGLCAKRPRSCDLSRGIVTNDTARSVVFRLAVSDPELLFKLALPYATPVPPGTPSRDIGSKPIPGTGPYRIVRSTARGIKFGRNALFREWSHAAQPAGYPDAIRWRYDLSPTAQTLAVERGQADWMFEQIPARLKSRIEIRHAAQLRISPALGTEFLLLDTRVPPFNKLAVRQALNYAIDRDGVARLYGGGALATPTCQVLPPGLPGYHAYCPYTLHPREHGRWIAPDLARARRLVAASGTYGRHVTVWATDRGFHATLARFVAGVLRSLGYRAQMRLVSDSAAVPGGKQLVTGTWFGGELGPTDFLQSWFACKGSENNGRYCDPRLDELMRRASAYQATDPDRAANAWAAVDRRVVDSAGWVPLVTPREVEFISQRVGNYQYHPIWGLLADQLWLH